MLLGQGFAVGGGGVAVVGVALHDVAAEEGRVGAGGAGEVGEDGGEGGEKGEIDVGQRAEGSGRLARGGWPGVGCYGRL